MMKKIFVLATMLLLCMGLAQARSWRINSDASKRPHFASINAAMSNAEVVAGDTLYLDPGCNLTADQNVTKQVTIIGCGYFLDGSPYGNAIINAQIWLKAAGIKMEGVDVVWGKRTTINASNVVLERCKLWDVFWSGTGQNTVFRQCFFGGRVVGLGTNSANSTGCTIENCIINYDYQGSFSAVSDFQNLTLRNNFVKCYTGNTGNLIANMTNATIVDNILLQSGKANLMFSGLTTSIVKNNVLSCAEGTYTAYPDNVCLGSNSDAVVLALEGSNDQRYRLKDDSPARGAATDGGDCGPFGGMYPYVCSGYPLGMPHFESSSMPTRPQDGVLRITQKVVLQAE